MLLELTNISEAIEITVIDIVRVSQYVLNSSGSESCRIISDIERWSFLVYHCIRLLFTVLMRWPV